MGVGFRAHPALLVGAGGLAGIARGRKLWYTLVGFAQDLIGEYSRSMSPTLKRLLSFAFLLLTLGIVLYAGFQGNDLEELAVALSSMSPVYLAICLACWALYVVCNALSVFHFLTCQGYRIRLGQCLHAAITGLYYSNITPGASGGQPMEMYCLSKYRISIGVSGSALAVKFVVFQAMLLLTGAVLWAVNFGYVSQHAPGMTWFIVLGYVVNFFSIGMVALMAISSRAVHAVIELCIRVGVRLKICKSPDASRLRWENHCQSFLSSVRMLIRKPRDVLVQCLIALVELFSLMAVIIALYHSFGLSGDGLSQLLAMGVLLYVSASFTPLPGASGAQEGGFAAFFRDIFPDATLFVALLIWRFSTYYLTLLVGALVSVVDNARGLKAQHTKE